MMNTIDSFLSNKSSRKRSAEIKLQVLIHGIRDNESLFSRFQYSFKEEHYAYDNGNWGVDKNRLVPSEILLPGGIICKLHIRPDSEYSLLHDNGTFLIMKGKKEISQFLFLPRPSFWDKETSSGIPIKQLAQIYGLNSLNFNIFSGCEFHQSGQGCHFCSVSSTIVRKESVIKKKSPKDLAEVCKFASDTDKIKYIIITGGSYFNSETEFRNHIAVLEAIRYSLPWNGRIKGNVSMMPPKDKMLLRQLYDLGVDNPSFNIEVWPKSNFEKICPGKEKYVGFNHIIDSLNYITSIYGSGKVWSNFVAGIVPIQDMKSGFRYMAERGIVPGANIYHAEVNSNIGKSLGVLSEKYITELYSFAAELYNKYDYKPYFDASVLRNSLANEFYEGLL